MLKVMSQEKNTVLYTEILFISCKQKLLTRVAQTWTYVKFLCLVDQFPDKFSNPYAAFKNRNQLPVRELGALDRKLSFRAQVIYTESSGIALKCIESPPQMYHIWVP